MSSPYQPKNKRFANVQVVTAEDYRSRKNELQAVGRVRRGMSAFVITPERKHGNAGFVEDATALTKKTKNEIVQFFDRPENQTKQSVYLVVPKSKVTSRGGTPSGF